MRLLLQFNRVLFSEKNGVKYVTIDCSRKYWGVIVIILLCFFIGTILVYTGSLPLSTNFSTHFFLIIEIIIGILIYLFVFNTNVIIEKNMANNSITVFKKFVINKKPIIFTPDEQPTFVLHERILPLIISPWNLHFFAIQSNRKRTLLVPSYLFVITEIFYIGLLRKDEVAKIVSYLDLPYSS